jgi:hypothetical protein
MPGVLFTISTSFRFIADPGALMSHAQCLMQAGGADAMGPFALGHRHDQRPEKPAWSAVFALTLCVSTLIASEFMPVSLLTPIAQDLRLTEGTAGQAIAISGLFAVLTSLYIAKATAGIDRRHLCWV